MIVLLALRWIATGTVLRLLGPIYGELRQLKVGSSFGRRLLCCCCICFVRTILIVPSLINIHAILPTLDNGIIKVRKARIRGDYRRIFYIVLLFFVFVSLLHKFINTHVQSTPRKRRTEPNKLVNHTLYIRQEEVILAQHGLLLDQLCQKLLDHVFLFNGQLSIIGKDVLQKLVVIVV